MHARWIGGGLLAVAVLAGVGCNVIGPIAYFLGPRRIQKAEHQLASVKLAIFTEFASPMSESPVFARALHDKLTEIFREKGVKAEPLPFGDMLRLPQKHADFRRWSVQRVGREVGAAQVLYIRVEEIRVREGPEHPLVNPYARLVLSVIDSTASATNARLWPDTPDGRPIDVSRPPEEYVNPEQADNAVAKLAADAARLVAQCFHDVDLEEHKPWEE